MSIGLWYEWKKRSKYRRGLYGERFPLTGLSNTLGVTLYGTGTVLGLWVIPRLLALRPETSSLGRAVNPAAVSDEAASRRPLASPLLVRYSTRDSGQAGSWVLRSVATNKCGVRTCENDEGELRRRTIPTPSGLSRVRHLT